MITVIGIFVVTPPLFTKEVVSGVPVEPVVEGLAAVEDKDVNMGVGRDRSTLIGLNEF